MSLRRPGPLALALATIGLGVLALSTRDLALFWQPIPTWIPRPAILAAVSGVLLISAGTGLFFPRTRRLCAFCLASFELVWVVTRIADALRHPARMVVWVSLCEALAVLLGYFLLAAAFSRAAGQGPRRLTSDTALLGARALFGACCVVFGLSHFAYAEFTAGMVPHWLPAHRSLVYLTGAAHLAAGLAILARRLDRLAATLEASMLGVFVLILHLPSLWASPAPKWAPTAEEQWSELLISLSVAGVAGTVAESLRDRPWGFRSSE